MTRILTLTDAQGKRVRGGYAAFGLQDGFEVLSFSRVQAKDHQTRMKFDEPSLRARAQGSVDYSHLIFSLGQPFRIVAWADEAYDTLAALMSRGGSLNVTIKKFDGSGAPTAVMSIQHAILVRATCLPHQRFKNSGDPRQTAEFAFISPAGEWLDSEAQA